MTETSKALNPSQTRLTLENIGQKGDNWDGNAKIGKKTLFSFSATIPIFFPTPRRKESQLEGVAHSRNMLLFWKIRLFIPVVPRRH